MGKPFERELAAIPSTVAWANQLDVSTIEKFVTDSCAMPLLAVGSGGSSTAAHFAALLHRHRHRRPAHHATPLEVVLSTPGLYNSAVMLTSASGKNRDILDAYDVCVANEVPAIAALAMRTGSPLIERASKYARTYAFDADVPTGKDGYLATNSLAATMALLIRGYNRLSFHLDAMPPRSELPRAQYSSVLILHGGWSSPVATDLESKFNESALSAALLADYRNFGHGRHLWLARRGDDTLVLSLETPPMKSLARRTLALLPNNVDVHTIRTLHEGPLGTLDLLVQSFVFFGGFANSAGQDPGRPSVPDFGRKLYYLTSGLAKSAVQPVERKLREAPVLDDRIQSLYHQSFLTFMRRLSAARFGAVVLDYDGTMCTREDRFRPLRTDLAAACERLLRAGVLIGIATGRGKSAADSMRESIDKSLWSNVFIGYYNGSEIGRLGDLSTPNRDGRPQGALATVRTAIENDSLIREISNIEPRIGQIALEPTRRCDPLALHAHVSTVVARITPDVRVVASSHSVDIVAAQTSKLSMVAYLRERISAEHSILAIGDRGKWPGNDTELLTSDFSLSVDTVSSDPNSCWNISAPGVLGPDATVEYLSSLRVGDAEAIYCVSSSAFPEPGGES